MQAAPQAALGAGQKQGSPKSLGQVEGAAHGTPAVELLRQQVPAGMQLVAQARVPAGHASMAASTVVKRTGLDGGLAAAPRRHETRTSSVGWAVDGRGVGVRPSQRCQPADMSSAAAPGRWQLPRAAAAAAAAWQARQPRATGPCDAFTGAAGSQAVALARARPGVVKLGAGLLEVTLPPGTPTGVKVHAYCGGSGGRGGRQERGWARRNWARAADGRQARGGRRMPADLRTSKESPGRATARLPAPRRRRCGPPKAGWAR